MRQVQERKFHKEQGRSVIQKKRRFISCSGNIVNLKIIGNRTRQVTFLRGSLYVFQTPMPQQIPDCQFQHHQETFVVLDPKDAPIDHNAQFPEMDSIEDSEMQRGSLSLFANSFDARWPRFLEVHGFDVDEAVQNENIVDFENKLEVGQAPSIECFASRIGTKSETI